MRRSGEVVPYGTLLKGARAGSLEGDRAPARLAAEYPMVLCFTGTPLVGVFVADRGGGGPRRELPGRDTGSRLIELVTDLVVDGGAEGVLERGGGLETTGVKLSR